MRSINIFAHLTKDENMKVGIGLAVVALAGCMVFSTVAQTTGATKQRKTQVVARQATDKYVCPMHTDVTSDKPGACTKCGMAMEKRAAMSDAMHAKKHAVGGACEGKTMAECMKNCQGKAKEECMKNCEGKTMKECMKNSEGKAMEGCAKECAGAGEAGCAAKH